MKGLTVNSRNRGTISLPGTALSHLDKPQKGALYIPGCARKEANLAALWGKFAGNFPKVDDWVPTTLAEAEEFLTVLRESKIPIQEDFDACKTASDKYFAEVKPLISKISCERVYTHAVAQSARETLTVLGALEVKMNQIKETLTQIDVRLSVTENERALLKFILLLQMAKALWLCSENVLSVVQ